MRKVSLKLVLVLLLATFCFADTVSKFAYIGSLIPMNGKTIEMSPKVVGMSEYVYVQKILDQLTIKDPCSIMFIIDNSGTNTDNPTDLNAQRFAVTIELIDIIYKKAPETKVGLIFFGNTLWFNKADDPTVFVAPGGGTGTAEAYIPLLDLNKIYNGRYRRSDNWGTRIIEEFSYSKKGIDVLKMYLQTIPNYNSTVGGMVSKYWPYDNMSPNLHQQLTNITTSFEAVKHAHLNQIPSLGKHRHFNIFLSDGAANFGDVTGYVQGTNVPTTFTIFYNADAADLARLEQMTANIKSNGYSTSNKLTNIWNLTSWQTIQQTLINDVFNKILLQTSGTPIKLIVNTTSSTNIVNNSGFLFNNIFPLNLDVTEFKMDFTYVKRTDSLDNNGNILWTKIDTVNSKINFFERVRDNVPVPDSVKLTWWGRDFALFYNNNTVTLANGGMKNLQVRFWEYKVDTTYGYRDVDMIISSKTLGDRDSFRLSAQSGYLDCNFQLQVNQTATPNDKILQVARQDSIIMKFKNPYLPLDTLRKAILFIDGIVYQVRSACYYDRTADGHADEMHIGIAGDGLDKVSAAIVNALTLPAIRQLTKLTHTVVPGGIVLKVREDAPEIRTACVAGDILVVQDTVQLPEDCKLAPCSVTIADSMAAVVMSALLIDSVKITSRDELVVDFSEAISGGSARRPFVFIKQGTSVNFSAALEPRSGSGATWSWFIQTIDGSNTIVENDSLRISEKSDVVITDAHTNKQLNPANLKRPIKVRKIPDGIIISSAVYYDADANGTVDKINITWSQKVGVIAADQITVKLSLPAARNFQIQGSVVNDQGITLTVLERSGVINTAVTPGDVVGVTDTIVFSASYRVVPSAVAVTDSVGPVIMRAQYTETNVPGMKGVLKADLSESVAACNAAQPFELCDNNGVIYRLGCSHLSTTGNAVVYDVITYLDNRSPSYGDSIRINAGADYSDNAGIMQKNPKNIRRPLSVVKSLVLVRAWYKDTDARPDGLIDQVVMETSVDLTSARADAIAKNIQLSAKRALSQSGAVTFSGRRVMVHTQETGTPGTAIDPASDKVTASGFTIDSLVLYAHVIPVEDSLPPVAIRGVYQPGDSISETQQVPDRLDVYFSETVQVITVVQPLVFYDTPGQRDYTMSLQRLGAAQSSSVSFTVLSSEKRYPVTGDSLWIRPGLNVLDLKGLSHQVKHKPGPLEVKPYPYAYELFVLPNPYDPDKTKAMGSFAQRYFCGADKTSYAGGMVFLAKPRGVVPAGLKVSGCVTVFDAVGNQVMRERDAVFNPDNGCLYYIWRSMDNEQGRSVGGGAYLCIFSINDASKGKTSLTKKIGVIE